MSIFLAWIIADKTSAFMEGIKAAAYIKGTVAAEIVQNEMVIELWNMGIGNRLPIQAFFYTNNGLSKAQYNQRDYYKQFGIVIPIVKMTLAQTDSQNASFNYYLADQVVK